MQDLTEEIDEEPMEIDGGDVKEVKQVTSCNYFNERSLFPVSGFFQVF